MSTTFMASDLIPSKQISSQNFKTGEDFTQLLLQVTQRALEEFRSTCQGQGTLMDSFDPLVGDTSCQIRAMMLIPLVRLFNREEGFREEINQTIQRIETIKNRLINAPLTPPNRSVPFRKFLGDQIPPVDFPLSSPLQAIVESFVLTKLKFFDAANNKERIDYSKFSNLFDDPSSTSLAFTKQKEFIEHLSKSLLEKSIFFIQALASDLNDAVLLSLTSPSSIKNIEGKSVLPTWGSMRILIASALKNNLPIAIRVHSHHSNFLRALLFLKEGKEIVHSRKHLGPLEPMIVLEGFSTGAGDPLKKILNSNFRKLVFANTAQHPQYIMSHEVIPFESLRQERPHLAKALLDEEREFHQMISLSEKGFSLDHPDIFCIDHIFAERAGNIEMLP